MAHVTASVLAGLWRTGKKFPAQSEPLCRSGFASVLAAGNYEGALMPGGGWIRFRCRSCATLMFTANTYRGIRHAGRVAALHQGACCAGRKAKFRGTETAWPDAEEAP